MIPKFKKDILLSEHTTIGLGGKAKMFISCKNVESIIEVLQYAKEKKINVQVISGGSNIIFPDKGFTGIVLKIDITGIENVTPPEDAERKEKKGHLKIKAAAGEKWDDFVKYCIKNDLTGVECLSGIPGSVGATPIQNVGAYGQEVRNIIYAVTALDRETYEIKTFTNKECEFAYRESRFKDAGKDKDKYIILDVVFYLIKFAKPKIRYLELQKYFKKHTDLSKLKNGHEKLSAVRKAVLELRKKKSMVISKSDPNSVSCGSFFVNPILNESEFNDFLKKTEKFKRKSPYFQTGKFYKLPAAWLIENAGFEKGYKKKNAGISENHSLALVNNGGTTKELLALAAEIEKKVFKVFGIKLIIEPEIL